MSEQDERLGEYNGEQSGRDERDRKAAALLLLATGVFRGPQGNQGNRGAAGERGQQGLSLVQGRAVVFLFLVAALFGAGNLFWTAHEVNSATTAQHREQAAQMQAGAAIGQKICTTFGKLAALKPPPGNPAANPARAYDQQLHSALAQLGPDLGCR